MTIAKSLLLSAALFCAAVNAHEYETGNIHIDHPWARALPPSAPTGAAYFIITNRGEAADRLLAVETPIAAYAEVHEHRHVDGLMKMQQVDGLELAAGDSVEFKPGGYHAMLFNLKQPLVLGETFPMTLTFEQAGSVEITVNVTEEAPAAKDDHGHGDHHGHH
jgi:copper(I)-binding protein